MGRVDETGGAAPGLPDDAFEHDGLITKRHHRAIALAFLRPRTGDLLWDVGSGSGAVSIEWARLCPGARAVGVERDGVRIDRARRNAARFEVDDRVRFVEGRASVVLAGLEDPDAVFVGGGGSETVLELCWEALRPGGRLVAHAVTLETEAALTQMFAHHGGALTRLSVEHATPIGRFWSWTPTRPIVAWAVIKATAL